jgi:hypothetical protein
MELLLTRYALERLLYRLSLSPHRERFVLKGAMLLAFWFDEPHRATRDVDLLGFGDAAENALLATFREWTRCRGTARRFPRTSTRPILLIYPVLAAGNTSIRCG